MTTEPSSTEPGSTEPGSTEPGSTEPRSDQPRSDQPGGAPTSEPGGDVPATDPSGSVTSGPDPRTATPARIRRAPRFGSFITAGVLIGLLVAVLVGLVRGTDSGWALLFVAATLMLVGGVAGAALSVVADRRSR